MINILGKTTSINVRKVLWTCEEAGLEYQQEDYGSGFASTETDAFRALNPNAMVPVLIDGDFVLWESNAICRYLVRKAGRHTLLPAEPQACANVERWMDWQATEFNNAWRYVFPALGRKNPDFNDPRRIAAGIKEWNHCITILENQLQRTGAFAAGETFTLADVVLGLSVNRWKMTSFDKPDVPAIEAWFERLNQRPAFLRHGNNGMM
ncbi:glutathione S-transferase family protein [Enterobacter mori]|uniref:glutathione S-transferase family protein n=1 Tax=Enterobacter mori TaxID=539813 RepID=UPI002DB92D57|nr:glutathione S-transferase family protein [Enterobacter mori]MEB7916214.1 glutathione S-transferase family protein [Enterobacter mori]